MATGFRILDAYIQVRAETRGVAEDAARQLHGQGSILAGAGGGLGSALMGGMQGVVGGLVGGVVAAVAGPLVNGVNAALDAVMTTAKTAIIDYNSKLQQANIGFTTMLGSAEKAKSFLGDLQKFAASTPFEFQDLTSASQRLIAMGVNAKDVIPYMTGIGDAVAGLGGGADLINQVVLAIGQMTAKGKVQGDDLMQLTEAGIPALKILADTYGVTTSEMSDMISAGKVLSDKAVPAIINGLEKGTKTTNAFGGMMDKQSKTMTGALSNIRDGVDQTLSTAFLPLFVTLGKVTSRIAKFAGSKEVSRWAKDTSKSFGDFMTDVEKGTKQVFSDPAVQKASREFLKDFNKGIKDSGPQLKNVLPDLIAFGREVLPDIIKNASKVAKHLPEMAQVISGLGTILRVVGPTVGDFIGFITDLALTFLGVPKAAAEMTVGSMYAIRDFTFQGMKIIGDFSNWMIQAGGTIVRNLAYGILGQGNPVADAIAQIVNQAQGVIGQFAANATKIVNATKAGAAVRVTSPGKGADAMVAAVAKKAVVPGTAGIIGDAVKLAGGGSGGGGGKSVSKESQKTLSEIFKIFRTLGKGVAANVKSGLLGSASDIKAAGKSMRDAVREAFDDKKIGKNLQSSMLAEIKKTTDRLVTLAKKYEDVTDRFKTAKDKLASLTSDRASFKAGIRDAAQGAGDIGSLYEGATTVTSNAMSGSLDGRSYQASYTTTSTKEGSGLLGFRQKLRQIVKDTRAFRVNLKELIRRGLDRFTVQQLLSAGATVGLPISKDLLNDKESFNDIVGLQTELNKAGTNLGELGAGYTYDSDIKSTKLTVDRLRDRRENITAVMVVEARKIDEVDKVVKAVNELAKTAKSKKAVKK